MNWQFDWIVIHSREARKEKKKKKKKKKKLLDMLWMYWQTGRRGRGWWTPPPLIVLHLRAVTNRRRCFCPRRHHVTWSSTSITSLFISFYVSFLFPRCCCWSFWFDLIWFDLIWFDLIWFDLIGVELIGSDRSIAGDVKIFSEFNRIQLTTNYA